MQKLTAENFLKHIVTLTPNKNFLIAYSGGLDSHVLLHLMSALAKEHEFSLRAIYINHQLSPKAYEWQQHCQAICKLLNVPFIAESIQCDVAKGESLEANARDARYAMFKQVLVEGEYLLTAHHSDDQAETVLIQLLRGAGVKGLAAMPAIKLFANGSHCRPLLPYSRQQLHDYALQHKLQWIEDESNQQVHFARNYLRHKVMPLLRERWPAVSQNLSRSAAHCAEASELLNEIAASDLLTVQAHSPETINILALQKFDFPQQRNILRYWIHQLGYSLPSEIKLAQVFSTAIAARDDAKPCVKWGEVEVRRYQQTLYIMQALPAHDSRVVLPWAECTTVTLPQNLRRDLDMNKLTVRFRQGGEKLKPAGSLHTRELKQLLQEWGVPPWQRDRVPLLYYGDELAAVIGYIVASDFEDDQ